MSPPTAAPGSRLRPETRSRLVAGLVAGAVVMAVLWWWWPTVTADLQRTDVVVIADGQLQEAADPIARRIRERGLSVEFVTVPGSWCDTPALTAEAASTLSPRAIVVSVRGHADCTFDHGLWSRLVDDAGSSSLVVVVQPGPPPLGFEPTSIDTIREGDGWIVADPTPLLGAFGETRLPCQWWDDCEPDGAIDVRAADGSLTPAGGERIARVIAAVLP